MCDLCFAWCLFCQVKLSAQNIKTSKEEAHNWDHIREFLSWKPLDAVKHTVAATTQLAKNVLRLPLHQHFKSHFPKFGCLSSP